MPIPQKELILLVKKTTVLAHAKIPYSVHYEYTAITADELNDPMNDCYRLRYIIYPDNKVIQFNYCENTDTALKTLLFIMG